MEAFRHCTSINRAGCTLPLCAVSFASIIPRRPIRVLRNSVSPMVCRVTSLFVSRKTANTLLEYTFQPGTYNFRIVNPTDAGALFPSLTEAQLSQVYTACTYNAPWVTYYLAFDVSALTNANEAQLFGGSVVPRANLPGTSSADSAYNAAKTGGYYNKIVSGPAGLYGGTVSTSRTFTSAETLIFAIPDCLLTDNNGGVSVLISPETAPARTPEPASVLAMLMGLCLLSTMRLLSWMRFRTMRQTADAK